MELTSVNYQCPACGGALRYDGGKGKLVCDYCGSEYEVSEIEQRYAEKEAKEADKAATASEETKNRAYVCSSCAAELVADNTTAVTICPYCGNPVVMESQVSGDFAPDLVVPFKLDHDHAVQALQDHYKGKILLPKSFREGNHVDEVQGVYVPFWLYDAHTEGDVNFEATRVRTHYDGDDEIIETDFYRVHRAGNMDFERVPVDGSTRMPDAHMDAIEPFDYNEMVPYSSAYMPGFVANRWDEDADACRPRAEGRMKASTENALESTVTGYDSVSTTSSDVNVDWKQAQYAMLPVWMLSTSWEGKNFLFAMNGQTGRMVGDLPVSKPKLIGLIALSFLIMFVIMWFGFDGSEMVAAGDTSDILISLVGVPALVAVVVGVFSVQSMKSAVEATEADQYLDQSSFNLTSQSDDYCTTTVQRIHHERDDNN
jgi:DNA-directed RNA polymerase subunit RPC12/RpoP